MPVSRISKSTARQLSKPWVITISIRVQPNSFQRSGSMRPDLAQIQCKQQNLKSRFEIQAQRERRTSLIFRVTFVVRFVWISFPKLTAYLCNASRLPRLKKKEPERPTTVRSFHFSRLHISEHTCSEFKLMIVSRCHWIFWVLSDWNTVFPFLSYPIKWSCCLRFKQTSNQPILRNSLRISSMNSLKKNILVTDPSLKKIPQYPGIIQNNKTNVIN